MNIKSILIIVLLISGFIEQAYPQSKKITLAVLYFENNSVVDKDKMEPLSKGIADMLITELTKIKAFKVVERERLNDVIDELKLQQTGVFDQSTAQKIGKLLGAQTLLLGSFMNFFGEQIRVDLRIVETETGLTLKAEEMTDDLDNLLQVVKDLASNVTEEMDIQLSSEEQAALEQDKSSIAIQSSLYYAQAVETEDKAREKYKQGDKDGAVSTYKNAIDLYQIALKNNPNLTNASRKVSNLEGLITEINRPEVKITKVNPPQVIIIEPSGYENGNIVHKEAMIAVHLNVVDEYGIERVTVNDNIADKLSSGGYYFNLSLNPGLNEIRITAINNKGMSTEKQFSVLVPTPAAGTIISIIEPPVMRGIKIGRASCRERV